METDQGCISEYYQVTLADLPVCCPMPDKRLWDAHPRVYLPIEKTGSVTCPYCATKYTLIKEA